MFNRRGKRSKKVTREVIIADGHTAASIPNPSGLRVYSLPQSALNLRFTCTTATTSTVTWANILDTVIMATTATQAADVFYAVRLHSVEIWLPASGAGVSTNNQCSLAFDSPTQGDQRLWVCSSFGGTGGYVKAVPSKKSLNGLTWQDSSSVGGFTLNNCPVGAVLQLNVTMRSRLGQGSAQIAAQAGSGMSVGTIYLRGLDGLAAASTKFSPIPASYAA